MAAADDILLCVVIGAHGLGGEVKVKTFTEDPRSVAAYGVVHAEDGRRFTLSDVRAAKDGAVIRVSGIEDRAGAESLKGLTLYVARAALPRPEADSFYHADLVGLGVEDVHGNKIGTVAAIHNYGAGDMIEIRRDDGPDLLLPFSKDAVPVVDIEKGRIVARVAAQDEPAEDEED